MMKFIVYEEATGLARYCVSVEKEEHVLLLPGLKRKRIAPEDEPDVLSGTVAVQNGQVISLPPKPDQFHVWNGNEWADPRPVEERLERQWDVIRGRRKRLLSECDWIVLPDAPVPEEAKSAWLAYRQALRDITAQTDPYNIVWPTVPEV